MDNKPMWCPLHGVVLRKGDGTETVAWCHTKPERVSDHCWYSASYGGTLNWLENGS